MKIGDKVRFLNDTGGGIVKGFKGKDIVLVEDEDGFEIPVLLKECVAIASGGDIQVKQTSHFTYNEIVSRNIQEEPIVEIEETKEGELITACLAFLPLDKKEISTTRYECYLINDSNYYLNYSYLNKLDQDWNCRRVGTIEPNTKIFLEEFGKEELNELERVCVQLQAYKKNKAFKLKNVYSAELRLDTVKFYKLHSFKENDYFDDDALIYPLVRKDLVEKELVISPEAIETAIKEKKETGRTRIISAKKTLQKLPLLEIDLHITELLDNTTGLDSSDILDYQLTKFREVLDENKTNKGLKIIFIHGKGNGVLKKALLEELKNKYKSYYIQDASFREYGYGATMVTIK